MQESTRAAHRSTVVAGLAVVALAAGVYANALANGLVWDDPIVLTRQLLAFRGFSDVFFPPRNIPQYSPDYYRPLTTLSYLIDRAIGGSGAFMFHLSVVLFHVTAAYLVFRAGLSLFRGTAFTLPAAAIGAVLFAVHPIHTESVAWGAGRSDVLACCGVLAATLAYWREDWPRMRRTAIAAALAFVAMLAKETAAAALLLLPASDAMLRLRFTTGAAVQPTGRAERRRQRERKREPSAPVGPDVLSYLPFAGALVLYLGLRKAAIGTLAGRSNQLDTDALAQLVSAVGFYGRILLVPAHQSAYVSDLASSPLAVLATAVSVAILVGLCVVAWGRGDRYVSFLVLWIGVTLAPSLAIVLKIPNAPVAERYLYLPSIGFSWLVGYGVAWLLQRATTRAAHVAILGVFGLLVAAAAAATVERNAVWRSNMSLWSDTVLKNTTDGLPMRSLAAAYMELGDTAHAAELFQAALQRRNDQLGRFTIENNLGSLAMREKHLDEAERHYNAAVGIDPNAPDALFNLGLIALTRALDPDASRPGSQKTELAQRARQQFERAAQLSPLDPDIEIALGQTLTALDDPAGARRHYERALQLGVPASTETSVRKLLSELR